MSASAHASNEHVLLGISYRMGALIGFGAMAAALKLGSEHGVSTVELLFYRNVFSFPVILIWLLAAGNFGLIRTRRPGAHITRSGIGLVSQLLNIQALVMLPLAEATTIGFAAPLFATILSAIVLKEQVGPYRWLAVVIGFLGVIIVVRPGSTALPPDGVAVAIIAAFGVASVVITLRQIGTTEHPVTTVFWFNIAALLVTGLPMPFIAEAHSLETWGILVVLGVSGGIAQLLMTSSVTRAPVAVLAPFDYSQLLWAMMLSWLIWSQSVSAGTIIGALLIASSGIYTAWREHRLRRREVAAVATPPQVESAAPDQAAGDSIGDGRGRITG